MVLSETDRLATWSQWMRDNLEETAFGKSDLRAALDATDDWIEANKGSYNGALPPAFRNNASLGQKTLLFCYVAMRRAGLLRVREDG